LMSDLLVSGLPPRSAMTKFLNRLVERVLHVLGYYTVLTRPGTRQVRIAGFRLMIGPTVYDPRFYRAPAFFAEFIGSLDLSNRRVADLGTGSGLQALAAALAGASSVVAIDVNPTAAVTAKANARTNGFEHRVATVASNLFSAIAAGARFDVVVTNPPFCDGKAWDVADRAWRAGPQYKDIAPLFEQARMRLAPDGVLYLILTSQSDLESVGALVQQAGFSARIVRQRRVFLETLIIYELRPI